MTFDARGGKSGFSVPDAAFGGGVLLLVALVFLAVFKGPDLFSGGSAKPAIAAEAPSKGPLFDVYKDNASQAFLVALQKADSKLYEDIEKTVKRRGNAPQTELNQLLMDESHKMLTRNASILAKADAKHFDAMLDWARSGLRAASRSGTQFCDGGFYTGFEGANQREVERMVRKMINMEGPLYEFGMKGNALMAEAIVDARRNPVDHGKVNSRDEQAVQGVVMSLMGDPQIMKLAMAANSSSPEQALRGVNVCTLADTLIGKFDRLPKDTKGRIFAQAMKDAGSANPFSALGGGFSGF